jgi:uncharacterized membrane protein YdjX (TVP38/TMEM64 family)
MKAILRSSTTWKLVGLGVVLVGLLLVAREFPIIEWVKSFAAWARGFGLAGALIYGVVFGLVSILMAPCLPLTITAGFTFGWMNGVIAVMLGIAIGAAVGFLFSRYAARGAIAQKIAANPRFSAIDNAIAKDGWKIVGLLRMCPVPFGITNYLYGLTAIDFWRYMGATMGGMLPATICFVYLGAFGRETLDGPRHPVQYLLGGLTLAAMIAVVFILGRIARRTAGVDFKSGAAPAR